MEMKKKVEMRRMWWSGCDDAFRDHVGGVWDVWRFEAVDQPLHLRHHLGADAVAGQEQQFMGGHDDNLTESVIAGLDPAIHPLRKTLAKMMDGRGKPRQDGRAGQ